MRSKLSRSLLLFSRSGLNRIGSDELISLSKSGSGEHLAPATGKELNVEGLCRELERKEKTIRDLRKQLGSLSIRSDGGQKSGPPRCLSSLSRSASITSIGAWIKRLSRRQSTGPMWTFGFSSRRDSRQDKFGDHRYRQYYRKVFGSTKSVAAMAGGLKRYTYSDLMAAPVGELQLELLEWHLTDEDLLDRMAICREFLGDLDRGDLNDRKYRASLTRVQYLMQRPAI